MYYSGQGRLSVAIRNSDGTPKGFRHIGNVSALELSIESTKFEHKESMSGQRAIDLTIVQEKNASFTMTLEDLDPENLAMGFWGESAEVAAGTDVAASITAYLDMRCPLPHPAVSNVVVTDETGTTTYVLDTDYTLDATYGVIVPLTSGSIVEGDVLDVTYDHAGQTNIHAFTETSMERWLRFEGLNTVDNKAVVVDMFKASLDPLSGYALINEELGSIELAGSVLYDELQAGTSKFFRQTNIT